MPRVRVFAKDFRCIVNAVLINLMFVGLGHASDELPSIKFESKFNPVSNSDYNSISLTQNLSFGGFEIKLSETELINFSSQKYRDNSDIVFRPEISLFSSKPNKSNWELPTDANARTFNRYKNSIPAIYRITLKGYSIMEYSYAKSESWSFDRIDNKAFRKPQIMFSVTKDF